jgi:hypothetical protein
MVSRKPLLHVLLIFAIVAGSVSCASTVAPRATLCAAEAEPDVSEYTPGGDITAPKVLKRVDPLAPNRLLGRNVSAKVEAIIGTDGVPRHVCVVAGDPDWGDALAAAVRQWRFQPATLNGQPVAVLFRVESKFDG